MTNDEITRIATLRGVSTDTVKRWIRERGDHYARNYVPTTLRERGLRSRIIQGNSTGHLFNQNPKSKQRAANEEMRRIGSLRRAVEQRQAERELDASMRDVWD